MRSRGSAPRRLALSVLAMAAVAVAVVPLVLDSGEPTVDGPTSSGVPVVDTSQPPPEAAAATGHAVPTPGPRTEVALGEEVAWVDGTGVPYSPASAFVLPGEALHVDVAQEPSTQRMVRSDSAGRLESLGDDEWVWTAPEEPGVHTLRVVEGGQEELVLRVFVMVPETEISGGRLNGYRMGTYPRVPLRGDTMYVRPDGFVEVTEANRELRVSPRFRLKHFETKQGDGFPRYVALQRRLLTKLELLSDALVDRGYPVTSLHIMSGYRTPWYNKNIGNTTTYSRHAWGDASDVFVDEDGDGWMDDLNQDGRVTRADARVLYEIVDSLDRALDTRRLVGGLSIYGPRSHRGPFVHLDTRGSMARW